MKGIICLVLILVSQYVSSSELDDVLNGNILRKNTDESNPELLIIKQLAQEYGVFYGRNHQIRKLNDDLEVILKESTLVDFQNFLIGENLLAPVVTEVSDVYEYMNEVSHKEVKHLYRVSKPARSVFEIPTIRSYINLVEDQYQPSAGTDLKLDTKLKKDTWKKYASLGAEKGKDHATEELRIQLAEYAMDVKGMMLAIHLNRQGMMDFSQIHESSNGIIVTDKAININEVVFTNSNSDKFVKDRESWKPFIQIAEDNFIRRVDYAK